MIEIEEEEDSRIDDDEIEDRDRDVVVISNSVDRKMIKITVEPVVFMIMLAIGLYMTVSQNFVIERVCEYKFNKSNKICENITANATLEGEVQSYAAHIQVTQSVIFAFIGIIMSLIMGSWSDLTRKRKPLIFAPLLGFMTSQALLLLMVYYVREDGSAYLPPELYILTAFSNGIIGCGGITTMLAGVYSMVSDESSVRSRTSRISIVDMFLFIGYPCGSLLSGHLFKWGGYGPVFGCTLIVCFINFLYTICFIKEGGGGGFQVEGIQMRSRVLKDTLMKLRGAFYTIVKHREDNKRTIMLLLLLSIFLNVSLFSVTFITFMFTQLRFSWSLTEYNTWSAFTTFLASSTSMFFASTLSKYWSPTNRSVDATIGLVGGLSGCLAYLVIAFASQPYFMYISAIVGCLSASVAMVSRSMLSKVVDVEELGRLFAIIASLESAVPLILTPLYVYIYTSTLDTAYLSAIFVVFSLIYFTTFSVFCVIRRLNSTSNYDRMIY